MLSKIHFYRQIIWTNIDIAGYIISSNLEFIEIFLNTLNLTL